MFLKRIQDGPISSRSSRENKQNGNLQKKIKGYIISYCQSQFFGKGIRGQIRVGFNQQPNNKRIYMFRIVSLPVSNQLKQFISLQRFFSDLNKIARVYQKQSIKSSSNEYIVMQYFPKTFYSQLQQMQNSVQYGFQMIKKFLQCYSWIYYMKICHNNLSLQNIGITFDGKIKLMDFTLGHSINNSILKQQKSFQQKSRDDLINFVNQILMKIFKEITINNTKDKNQDKSLNININRKQKQLDKIIFLKQISQQQELDINKKSKDYNWQDVFKKWQIENILCPLYNNKNMKQQKRIQNIIIVLHKLNDTIQQQKINSDYLVDIKYALMLLMYSYIIKVINNNKNNKNKDINIIQNTNYYNINKISHNNNSSFNSYQFKNQNKLLIKTTKNNINNINTMHNINNIYSIHQKSNKSIVNYTYHHNHNHHQNQNQNHKAFKNSQSSKSQLSHQQQYQIYKNTINSLSPTKQSKLISQLTYKNLQKQYNKLKKVLQPIKRYQYYNSILHDIIKDPNYFGFNSSQRLALIALLIPQLNHQYLYQHILHQFLIQKQSQQNKARNHILSQGLLSYYWFTIINNLIKI